MNKYYNKKRNIILKMNRGVFDWVVYICVGTVSNTLLKAILKEL
jgi:hypothetical protein